MVFGACPHVHTIKLVDKIDQNNGFVVCGDCSKDPKFANWFTAEKLQ